MRRQNRDHHQQQHERAGHQRQVLLAELAPELGQGVRTASGRAASGRRAWKIGHASLLT
jgi:hypothetical protein